nr:ParB N-terminal domain-containing protein [Brevundimonas diminuta]
MLLNTLKASPRNARKVKHSAAAIEALAASIKAKGVLQPPCCRDRAGRGGRADRRLVRDHRGRTASGAAAAGEAQGDQADPSGAGHRGRPKRRP